LTESTAPNRRAPALRHLGRETEAYIRELWQRPDYRLRKFADNVETVLLVLDEHMKQVRAQDASASPGTVKNT
jgi:hypothetical protein